MEKESIYVYVCSVCNKPFLSQHSVLLKNQKSWHGWWEDHDAKNKTIGHFSQYKEDIAGITISNYYDSQCVSTEQQVQPNDDLGTKT